jgi:hypothetical protein
MKHCLLTGAFTVMVSGGWAACVPTAARTDSTAVVSAATSPLPAQGEVYCDEAFGSSVMKLIDGAFPIYSELQAWNADMTLLNLTSRDSEKWGIYRVDTMQKAPPLSLAGSGVSNATGFRWSPTEPDAHYFIGTAVCAGQTASGAVLMRARLHAGNPMTWTLERVGCYPEYLDFMKDESWEELSEDGRYIALIARRPVPTTVSLDGWIGEAVVIDVMNGNKRASRQLPLYDNGHSRTPDHISMSPSGNYAVISWAKRPFTPNKEDWAGSLVAYDARIPSLPVVGQVNLAGTSHSGFARDAQGNDYVAYDGASSDFGNDWPTKYIFLAKLPSGVPVNASNTGWDTAAAFATGSTVRLLGLSGTDGLHISGLRTVNRPEHGPGFVVATVMSDFSNGRQPYEDEIVKIYLDSRHTAPHMERLVQHRSYPAEVPARDGCVDNDDDNYWSQPHATVSGDGMKVMYGSNWERICMTPAPVDAYVIDLNPGAGPGGPGAVPERPRRLKDR